MHEGADVNVPSLDGPDAQGMLRLSGDWTLAHLPLLEQSVARARGLGVPARVDAVAVPPSTMPYAATTNASAPSEGHSTMSSTTHHTM